MYRERSLSKTCSNLGLTLPTGSRTLSKLRKIFQDELFLKSGAGMIPTEKCENLRPAVEENLKALDALVRDEVFDPSTLQKTFRLGIVDNAYFNIFIPVLNRLHTEAPLVNFDIPEIRFSHLFEYLTIGEVDLMIYPYSGKLPSGIKSTILFSDHMVYVSRKGHPLEKVPEDNIRVAVASYPLVRASMQKHFLLPLPYESDVSREEHYVKSPFFIGSAFACLESNNIAVLPLRTARILSKWLPLTVYGTKPCQMSPFFPKLLWHVSKHRDPAKEL